MDDEIRAFAEGRPQAPPYGAEARARARERLVQEARGGRRFRPLRLGWQAAAAFGVTVVLVGGVAVALSNQGSGPGPATTVTQSAGVAPGEPDPRPGQYILIESETMYAAIQLGKGGEESRHLYRTHRKIWQSVDGSAAGLLMIEGREPQAWPGEELPESAKDWQGTSWHTLASCPGVRGEHRTDYAYLGTLPAESAAMREHLYRISAGGEGKGVDRDMAAFTQAHNLLTETYLPAAQRRALFEAVKSMPGVQTIEGVKDSSGREGVALATRAPQGSRQQLIFDQETFLYLGERQVVVEEGAKAPKGSVLAWTSQLSASVVDRLPEATVDPGRDASCDLTEPTASAIPAPSVSGSPPESPHPDASAHAVVPESPIPGAPTASAVPESSPAPTASAEPGSPSVPAVSEPPEPTAAG
ncbi:hypothetical protein FXF51_18570 [Nonomuraea sp. PA05]|uniref:CU044_5270 family protein n=1 Tax=Nonomuraea sp. PA05 TaxID=2604466 RepID=UPI0011D73AC1|nr:CU044_5270 family protein [Nonomuraea sp. PA05]TYB66186.1 hypothetical protein FXF51_18570 [Nonomuraea sp. PA05]